MRWITTGLRERWRSRCGGRGGWSLPQTSGAAPRGGAHPKNKPRPRDGDYNVSIGGYFKGEGTGTINGDQIKFQLSVMSDTSSKGVLEAPNLTITGNHFAGPGNFQGQKVTFD